MSIHTLDRIYVKIFWSPRARSDIFHVISYIENDNPEAAQRVVLRVLAAIENLPVTPQMGTPDHATDTRKLFIPSLPYFVCYRVEKNTIQILRVYHTDRKWSVDFNL